MEVVLQNLTKIFPSRNKNGSEVVAVNNFDFTIPDGIDYINMHGLALEARQKLDKIRPLTIGQASRISGVNPSDISILILNIKRYQQSHE